MTSYFVRTLLSEGRIDYEVTVRDRTAVSPRRRSSRRARPTGSSRRPRRGSTPRTRRGSCRWPPTTRARRPRACCSSWPTKSDGDGDLAPWRDLQRWLAGAEHRVTIPYARQLAQMVPPVAVRLRRDFGSLLALIRAHAVLHQASRERDDEGRIVATLDDYAVVRDLVADTMAEGVGATVSDTVRETVAAVAAIAPAEGVMARGRSPSNEAGQVQCEPAPARGRRRRLRAQPGGQAREARPLGDRRPTTRDRRPAAGCSATRKTLQPV